jgi:hypothetical protein
MSRPAAYRRNLSPFERHLLAKHLSDPAVRAAEIARRRQARTAATCGGESTPLDRFIDAFLSFDPS